MQTLATCTAAISKNGECYVLLVFESDRGHFIGEITKDFGELKQDKTYRVVIEEVAGL